MYSFHFDLPRLHGYSFIPLIILFCSCSLKSDRRSCSLSLLFQCFGSYEATNSNFPIRTQSRCIPYRISANSRANPDIKPADILVSYQRSYLSYWCYTWAINIPSNVSRDCIYFSPSTCAITCLFMKSSKEGSYH